MCLPAQSLLTNDICSSLLQTIDREHATATASHGDEKERMNAQPKQHQVLATSASSPVVVAAICDSALALTAKSMDLPDNRQNHIVGLVAFAALLYLVCAAFTNYLLCGRLGRASLLA